MSLTNNDTQPVTNRKASRTASRKANQTIDITANITANTRVKSKAQRKVKMINMMVIAALTSAPLITTSSFANTLKTEQEVTVSAEVREEVGLGTGMIIGAIFGGPVGAFITGIAGTFIAKNINATEEVDQLTLALNEQEGEYQQEIALFNRKLEQAEQAYQSELLALEQNYQSTGQLQAENLLMSLQFSTGSSVIAPHYQEQIIALAELLNQATNMSIDLSGYTDLQGSEVRNHNLSLARVTSVKDALVAHGVSSNRIGTSAYGEAAPVVANAQQEVSFYDRRVVVKLHNRLNQTAKNN